MFCSVKDRACLDISVPGLGMDVIDLLAASKNIPNAFSAWSMVFSANSRNSAGTSSLGSFMSFVLRFGRRITTIWQRRLLGNALFAARAPIRLPGHRLGVDRNSGV